MKLIYIYGRKSVYNSALFLLFLQSNFILFCKILFCYGSFVLALLLLLSVENIHCDSITKKKKSNLYTRKLSVFSLKKCPILLYFYVIFEMCLIFLLLLLLLLMVGIYCTNEIKVFLLLF